MQLTNRLGLPQLLVDAIRNDTYDSGYREEFGPRYITATQLVRPPQMNRLLWEHATELSEDVADRIWSLQGQSIHTIIERAVLGRSELLVERRLYAQCGGWTIGGQVDLFDLNTGELSDWKVTSVWSVLGEEMKPEWVLQLGILSWLLWKNGYDVQRASIVAILRDWSRTKAKYEKSYPQEPARVLDLVPWGHELVETWIEHRLEELEAEEPRACSEEERWRRGGGYAAKKKAAKRASKLFDSYEEAEKWVLSQKDSGKFVIEGREGEDIRCTCYCQVRAFCRQALGNWQAGDASIESQY
jgi:hypothetical protein